MGTVLEEQRPPHVEVGTPLSTPLAVLIPQSYTGPDGRELFKL